MNDYENVRPSISDLQATLALPYEWDHLLAQGGLRLVFAVLKDLQEPISMLFCLGLVITAKACTGAHVVYTQGPPGSGKSYSHMLLWLVLIVFFKVKIRIHAIQNGTLYSQFVRCLQMMDVDAPLSRQIGRVPSMKQQESQPLPNHDYHSLKQTQGLYLVVSTS